MLITHRFRLAPWIVKKKNVLLGPKLNAIRVPHLDVSIIPPNKLEYLIQNNYVIDKNKQENIYDVPIVCSDELKKKRSNTQLNWIWISNRSFLKVALLLKKYLLLFDLAGQWEVVTDKKIILKALKGKYSQKPFIIKLSHKEPISEKAIKTLYADLINKAQIIWIGETIEGTHIGPIIRTTNELEKYLLATKNWYFSKKLIEFGFKDYWPLPIYLHLLSAPKRVAEAISRVIKAPAATCFLIEENREVCLWTKLIEKKISESKFFKIQLWSKGLIRNFQIKHFDSVNEGYIAKCRSPCKSIDYLEGNSGKGIDSTSATYSLVGESVERFSAWQSNQKLITINKPKKNIYDIYQFHPFGPKWENYLASSRIELPLCKVRDEINSNESYFVPKCLVPFPYEAPKPRYDVTTSSTSGLAVYNEYKKAIIKGALELFERNNFYNFFLFQKHGFILDFSEIKTPLQTPLYDFISFLNHLKSTQLHYWCLVYDLESTLPIIHCFIHDQKHNFFSRGSGSGYTLLEATASALVEALQIRQQFLKNDNQSAKGYNDWRNPNVVEKIQAYLGSFQKLSFFDHPIQSMEYTSNLLLEEIKKNLRILRKPLLVADLPCPIAGWSAVRVLIPGFTTHQFPAEETLGGKRIINPVFKYGIPT